MFFLLGVVFMLFATLFLLARSGSKSTWVDGWLLCLGFVGFVMALLSVVYKIAQVMP